MTKRVMVTSMLTSAKTSCHVALAIKLSVGLCSRTRSGNLAANCCKATSTDVTRTETESNKPTIPTMPRVSARPCRKVRDVVPQMRFSARSTTAKTQEPAQSTTTAQVIITSVLRLESERIVERRNSEEPG